MSSPIAGSVLDAGTVRNFHGPRSHQSDPLSQNDPAARLQTAMRRMPKAGEEFVGFRLVRELGRGSFGRVFLATQSELAGRPVALKVSADLTGESRSLAQLQHTNIVPVYSIHRDGCLEAVCMPYFGSTTLADLISRCRTQPALPATGRELVNTLRNMVEDTRPDSIWDSVGGPSPSLSSDTLSEEARTEAVFAALSGMSYPEAVAWLVARVADGLAHAHERGILHRDIKPANVLLTDDGQPMLLDFGVAEDLKVKADATGGRVGGTVPYMAPEHLDEIRTDERQVDVRSDIYSLGVILYELLTGRHPFRVPTEELATELPVLIDERRRWVPDVCSLNPEIPADLASIVRTCVAALPSARYQTAADLRDDLDCHLQNLPLKVASDGPVWARLQKWRKRNPRAGTQALVASGVLATLGMSVGTIAAWKRLDSERAEQVRQDEKRAVEQARHAAVRELGAFRDELRHGQYLLTGKLSGSAAAADGMSRLRAALDRYDVCNDADWKQKPAFAALPEPMQQELGRSLSDACLLLARGHIQFGSNDRTRYTVAARFNALAETLRDGPAPRAVLTQRAELYQQLNEKADAAEFARRAESTPLKTAEDYRLSADELLGQDKPAAAIQLYRKAVRLDPQDFWAHFNLGVAYQRVGQHGDARASYGTAIALRSEFIWTYFNRALAGLSHRAYDDAIADFDRVIELNPDYTSAYLHRAQGLAELGNAKAALIDLNAVLEMKDPGGLHGRAYLMRAKIKRAGGDAAGAKADTEAGLKITPVDETGWLVQALALLDTDLPAAHTAVEMAVKLNPTSIAARVNQAHVLDKMGKNRECFDALERLIELAPNDGTYRGARAVLLARLGRADDAIRSADEAVAQYSGPMVRYQAACVYAILSQKQPEHRAEAVRLLTAALATGFPVAEAETDKDIDAIRDEPEVKKALANERKK